MNYFILSIRSQRMFRFIKGGINNVEGTIPLKTRAICQRIVKYILESCEGMYLPFRNQETGNQTLTLTSATEAEFFVVLFSPFEKYTSTLFVP